MKTRVQNRKELNPRPTPNIEFRMPILLALIEMGGGGRASDVLSRVYELTRSKLNTTDYEFADTRSEPRWRHASEWERNTMREEGLIKTGSPHGYWEISDLGVEYYNRHKK